MIISEMPIENLFQFKPTFNKAGFQKRNIAVPTKNSPVAVQPSISVSTPSIDVPALEVTQSPENDSSVGENCFGCTAITWLGQFMLGIGIYKKNHEDNSLQRNQRL
jgi:hypothetical protein